MVPYGHFKYNLIIKLDIFRLAPARGLGSYKSIGAQYGWYFY